jgi:hypothetical protein
MTSSDVDTEANRLTPAEAFKTIANETRIQILQELAETKERPVTFTELRKRVGLRDGSQFNYHLQKLENGFVQKTGEGYLLTHSGYNVLEAITSGAFTHAVSVDPVGLDASCVDCGGSLVGRYENDLVQVACSACDQLHVMCRLPPSGVIDRSAREIFTTSDRHLRANYRLVVADICPGCRGRMDRTVVTEPHRPPDSILAEKIVDALDFEHGPGAFYECRQCERWAYLSVGEHLLHTPELLGFFRDRGYDLDVIPLWELPWTLPSAVDDYTTVTSTDPPTFEFHVPLDGDELVVVLDERLDIVDTTTNETERATA